MQWWHVRYQLFSPGPGRLQKSHQAQLQLRAEVCVPASVEERVPTGAVHPVPAGAQEGVRGGDQRGVRGGSRERVWPGGERAVLQCAKTTMQVFSVFLRAARTTITFVAATCQEGSVRPSLATTVSSSRWSPVPRCPGRSVARWRDWCRGRRVRRFPPSSAGHNTIISLN